MIAFDFEDESIEELERQRLRLIADLEKTKVQLLVLRITAIAHGVELR